MENKNILTYFSDFSLKQKAFFCFSCKEEGIHDKVTGLISLSLYAASEHLIVFSCLNKMPLKQNNVCFLGKIDLSFVNGNHQKDFLHNDYQNTI